ncbi:hypothetical protein [Paenibacillus glucanolyticus]|uniref:hypothetical protein n=1 Tax=Paenibacillus glucanolyticus TaxID=59843 RepID=UPI000FDBF2F9|nr:hypothetical protein [Paenibacillus glucanolyticus]
MRRSLSSLCSRQNSNGRGVWAGGAGLGAAGAGLGAAGAGLGAAGAGLGAASPYLGLARAAGARAACPHAQIKSRFP